MNETRLERIYANNQLKCFKTKNIKDSSIEQIEICKILNATSEDFLRTIKRINILIKDIRRID